MSAAVTELRPEGKESKAALLIQAPLDGSNGPPGSATIAVDDEMDNKRKGSKGSDQQGGKALVVVRDKVSGAFKGDSYFIQHTRAQYLSTAEMYLFSVGLLGGPTRRGLTWTGHFFAVLVPFLSMLIGGLYIEDCPANRNIPIYLIVLGAVTALVHISTSIDIYRKLPYVQTNEEQKPAILTLISIFLLVWVIVGCVWTFSLYPVLYSSDYEPWSFSLRYANCNYTLFWFAFWVNILAIISWLFGLCICCCACGLLCHAGLHAARSEKKQDLPPEVKV